MASCPSGHLPACPRGEPVRLQTVLGGLELDGAAHQARLDGRGDPVRRGVHGPSLPRGRRKRVAGWESDGLGSRHGHVHQVRHRSTAPTPSSLGGFWAAALGSDLDEDSTSDEGVRGAGRVGRSDAVVPAGAGGQGRQEPDALRPARPDADAPGEVTRLEGLGATVLRDGAAWSSWPTRRATSSASSDGSPLDGALQVTTMCQCSQRATAGRNRDPGHIASVLSSDAMSANGTPMSRRTPLVAPSSTARPTPSTTRRASYALEPRVRRSPDRAGSSHHRDARSRCARRSTAQPLAHIPQSTRGRRRARRSPGRARAQAAWARTPLDERAAIAAAAARPGPRPPGRDHRPDRVGVRQGPQARLRRAAAHRADRPLLRAARPHEHLDTRRSSASCPA